MMMMMMKMMRRRIRRSKIGGGGGSGGKKRYDDTLSVSCSTFYYFTFCLRICCCNVFCMYLVCLYANIICLYDIVWRTTWKMEDSTIWMLIFSYILQVFFEFKRSSTEKKRKKGGFFFVSFFFVCSLEFGIAVFFFLFLIFFKFFLCLSKGRSKKREKKYGYLIWRHTNYRSLTVYSTIFNHRLSNIIGNIFKPLHLIYWNIGEANFSNAAISSSVLLYCFYRYMFLFFFLDGEGGV